MIEPWLVYHYPFQSAPAQLSGRYDKRFEFMVVVLCFNPRPLN